MPFVSGIQEYGYKGGENVGRPKVLAHSAIIHFPLMAIKNNVTLLRDQELSPWQMREGRGRNGTNSLNK